MSYRDGANSNAHICTRSRPCNRWRDCHYCAAKRQARVADAVERLGLEAGRLRWHIMYPDAAGAAEIKRIRDDWMRNSAPLGAVWTIEQSRKTHALHLNLITPADNTAAPRGAAHWSQLIEGNPRAVGAYIAKRGQMPSAAACPGRLFGTAGQIWQILAAQKSYAAVAAAAAQYAINSHAMIDQAAVQLHKSTKKSWQEHEQARLERENPAPKNRDDFREIAARWMPDLLDFKERNRPKSQLEINREWLRSGLPVSDNHIKCYTSIVTVPGSVTPAK